MSPEKHSQMMIIMMMMMMMSMMSMITMTMRCDLASTSEYQRLDAVAHAPCVHKGIVSVVVVREGRASPLASRPYKTRALQGSYPEAKIVSCAPFQVRVCEVH
jgi:hypothetical protein